MSRVVAVLVALVMFTWAVDTRAQVQGGGTPGVAVPALPPRPDPPPRDAAPATTGTARLRGRVVAAEDSRPIRRAAVRVTAPELREGKSTATDVEGRYELADLPAGRYTVTVTKAGFVTISHGQTRPGEMGRPLEVRDRQTVDRIDFALPRGAAITGRIVDEYGEPVAGVNVVPLQLRYVNGQLQPATAAAGGFVQTPDTGEFRVWGLPPGEYFLQANVLNVGQPFESDDRSGYAATYYPGTANSAEAQAVRLQIGQTVSGIDITLMPARTARITGTAIDSRGQPLGGGFVAAMPQRNDPTAMMSSRPGQIRPDGTFTVSGLTPGTYVVRATVPRTAPGAPPETLVATVTVAGDDVSGVVLMPLQPVTVAGRILFDPPVSSLVPSMIRVMAGPKNPGMMMPMPMTGPPIVNEDFSFEVKAASGEAIVRAMVVSGTDWVLKSVTIDGRDVTDSGIDLVSGRDVKDAEILLTNRVSTVSGLVTDQRAEIAAGATVFIFAQDRERWFGQTRYAAVGRPDQNGRYSLRTLPPGDYYAVAVEYLDPNRRSGDPTYLERLAEDGVRFTLQEGETKALDLKLAVTR